MKLDRTLVQDVALGVVVFLFGLMEILRDSSDRWLILPPAVILMTCVAGSAALFRRLPGTALALAWAALAFHLLSDIELLYTEAVFGLVAYGTARYGSRVVVWLAGVSIPFAALFVGLVVLTFGRSLLGEWSLDAYTTVRDLGLATQAIGALAALSLLALPYAAGLVVRSRATADASKVQEQEAVASRLQAEELAASRAEQTRLAHDVHDVVGHSLAVILAQAESAQFLDDDPARLKETMATIATSARQSLQDVRHVLATGTSAAPRSGGVDELIAGVRDAGHVVTETVLGQARPLPPELETVAYRSVQEMLTNALKHGDRSRPISVLRHWSDQLTIAVENAVAPGRAPGDGGLGLAAMEQRLAAVGGRLDVREDAGVHTVTATLPLRAAP